MLSLDQGVDPFSNRIESTYTLRHYLAFHHVTTFSRHVLYLIYIYVHIFLKELSQIMLKEEYFLPLVE